VRLHIQETVTSFSKPNRSSGESKIFFFFFWTVGSVVGGGEEEEEGISWRLEGCAGIFELLWETIGGCGVVECGQPVDKSSSHPRSDRYGGSV
jgi:hypothetical protein